MSETTLATPFRGQIDLHREMHFNETLDLEGGEGLDHAANLGPSFEELEENFRSLVAGYTIEDSDDDKARDDRDEEKPVPSRSKRKRSDDVSHLLTRLTDTASELVNLDDADDEEESARRKHPRKESTSAVSRAKGKAVVRQESPDTEDSGDDMDKDDFALQEMKSILQRQGRKKSN